MSAVLRGLAAMIILSGAAFFMGEYHNDVYRKLLLWVTLALGALRRTATIGSGQEGCPGCSAGPRFIPTVGAARHRLSAGANRPSVLTGGSLNRQSVRPGLAFALAKTASRVLSRHYTLNKDILARVPREAGCKSRPLRRLK